MSAVVSIGALRHRLSVEEPVETEDALGGATILHVVTGDTWAAIRAKSLAEKLDAADRLGGVVTHEIVLRADVTVRSGWRLSGGGRRFRVLSVASPNDGGGFLRCLAEEESG